MNAFKTIMCVIALAGCGLEAPEGESTDLIVETVWQASVGRVGVQVEVVPLECTDQTATLPPAGQILVNRDTLQFAATIDQAEVSITLPLGCHRVTSTVVDAEGQPAVGCGPNVLDVELDGASGGTVSIQMTLCME